ncbi:alpha/beta fold hydrolase [Neobacillus sp. NRS-1170]|uniref:alpha/beta fold hydrolase n=1 Tax=Neobacillus sp. NRS-1170 TaxID=3233898 RepID=UPI003D288F4E
MKKLEFENSTIAYTDQGEGEPIVLLHGFCGSSQYWEEVVPELSKNYRVIVPDLPGHGQSDPFEDTCTIDDFANRIKGLLDELTIQKVTMFGHSLGGYITLAFAEKYSDRLKGFSLVHSTAFPDSDEAKKGRDANAEKIKHEGIQPLIEGLIPKLFSADHQNETYVETAKKIGFATPPQGAIGTLIAMKDRPDRNKVLETTNLPVLLIAGEHDQIIPAEKTFSVKKATIRQSVIKNAGHMSMYEEPKELISDMKLFLSSIYECC